MRLSILAAAMVALLLVLGNVLSPVGAARRQKRLQLLKPQQQKHTYGQSSSLNTEAHARSADTLDTPDAPLADNEQTSADSGRGFMAKWMMLKSMLHPPQPTPNNNIIIVTQPTYTTLTTPTTTPTTTTITTPTSTYTTPTTSTVTNTTRGQFTHVVYARQDNGAHEGGVRLETPAADAPLAPTMTNAPQLPANAGIPPLFMGTKPGMTNQIPMMGQFPRPAPQRRRNNNHGQLNQNARRRRIQTQRRIAAAAPSGNDERNKQVNNYNKRRRLQVQGAGGKPLPRPKRRKGVQTPNQIRKVNRKGNSGDSVVNVNKVDQVGVGVGVGAGNKFDTNSRLQHFMQNLRHPQTPIVHKHH